MAHKPCLPLRAGLGSPLLCFPITIARKPCLPICRGLVDLQGLSLAFLARSSRRARALPPFGQRTR
eukprot:147047-Hanusia_phi.AAC.1